VAPIHPKAMPVILTAPAEVDQWLEAETPDALTLQRPLADDTLAIVARGEREKQGRFRRTFVETGAAVRTHIV
jgi:putative SOS response-associated peptidase YedK